MPQHPITDLQGKPLQVEVSSLSGETLIVAGFKDEKGTWVTSEGVRAARGIPKATVRSRGKRQRVSRRRKTVLVRRARFFTPMRVKVDFFCLQDFKPLEQSNDGFLPVAEIARRLKRAECSVRKVVSDAGLEQEYRDYYDPQGKHQSAALHARLNDVRQALDKRPGRTGRPPVEAPPGYMTFRECEDESQWSQSAWRNWAKPKRKEGKGCPWLNGRILKTKTVSAVRFVFREDFDDVIRAHDQFRTARKEGKLSTMEFVAECKKPELWVRKRLRRYVPEDKTHSARADRGDRDRPNLYDPDAGRDALTGDDSQKPGELSQAEAAQRFRRSPKTIRRMLAEFALDAVRVIQRGPKAGAKVAPVEAYEAAMRGQRWTPPTIQPAARTVKPVDEARSVSVQKRPAHRPRTKGDRDREIIERAKAEGLLSAQAELTRLLNRDADFVASYGKVTKPTICGVLYRANRKRKRRAQKS